MKSFVILLAIVSIAAASIDVSNVKPIHQLPEWREAHSNLLQFFPLDPEIEDRSRIVNGQEAARNQFPYQTALLMVLPTGTGLCGGTIISANFVLTAAHCVDMVQIIRVTVSMGAHALAQIGGEAGRVDVEVLPNHFIIHAGWDASVLQNDIALLNIVSGITFSATIQPVRLPVGALQNQNFAGQLGRISGWGRFDDASNDVAAHLQWGTSEVMTNTLCNVFLLGIVTGSHICIDGRVGAATCQGDSGGPLAVVQPDGTSLQVGITSFGIALGCALRFPSVFTRVSSFISWIAQHTGGQIG